MAGAGYKLFNTGDVLTAAQVNTYLMQQTVMVFASATARNTALSGILAEGLCCYLTDVNDFQIYDGSSWVSYGSGDITGVTAGTGLTGGGTSGSVTLAIDSTVATLTGSQTLTNKTLTTPVISSISNTGTLTLPTSTDTLVGRATTDTLTNKTISASSNTLTGVINNTLTTTTGDLIYASSANTPARLGIGTSGQVLTVSGGVPTWGTASGSSGPTFYVTRNADQTYTTSTWTKVQFNTESWDTDNCFDSTTNYRFTPNKAGYYHITTQLSGNGATTMSGVIYKNGSEYKYVSGSTGDGNATSGSIIIYFNGSTDYIEVYMWTSSGTKAYGNVAYGVGFGGVWIRS